MPVPHLQRALGDPPGRLFIKADHLLPVAGSIKARGGVHEVLELAERLAQDAGLIAGDDLTPLLDAPARALFGRHEVAVGSTGNLGLSIGVIASALGFRSTVHMSADAKGWKKERLRRRGVSVIEHGGDYAAAVAAGRQEAASDPACHFVDDERSSSLFLGYAAAASHLQRQLAERSVQVDEQHPLFVYIPCGVGGAPGGIAFGLAHLFGPHVHCFFAEPTASPCFLVAMMDSEGRHPSVYDFGLDNRTEADGLAVPRASECAVEVMRTALAGVFTVPDEALFRHLHVAAVTESLRLEPSATAAFDGPAWLTGSERGRAYLAQQGIADQVADATHVVWTTGGLFVPQAEYERFLARGAALNAA
jgi:D-serine dehydratase